MRTKIFAYALTLAITGCGNDSDGSDPDAAPDPPPPRVIPGGGIGDGPIEGVANVYVIDDDTRDPIANATVRVGDVEGTTDATGLFVAEGVSGPQQVTVKASGKRHEMWLGANGANMTFSLELDTVPNPQSATLSGAITMTTLPALATNHAYYATVNYSASDELGDDANEIATANSANSCFVVDIANPCAFSVTTRTGSVALVATIIDVDTKGTESGADDTYAQVAWAFRAPTTVAANATMTGMNLTPILGANLADVTVELGTPPAALTERAALVQMELPDRQVLNFGFATPAAPTLRIPTLSAISGATGFRLIALASDGGTPPTESIVIRKGLAASPLVATGYLGTPSSVDVSRTGASWGAVAGATAHSVEYTQGTARLLNVTSFDAASTLFTIPDLVALPGGAITVKVGAIAATDFDVTNFSLDADRDKLDRVGQKTIELR